MEWDPTVFQAINGLAGQSALLDEVMVRLGRPGQLIVPILLAFGYWIWMHRRQALIGTPTLAVLIVLVDFIGAQLKHLTARPRPCQVLPHVHEVVGCGGTFSFPSNHALNTATAAAFFQVLYPATGWVSWPLVAVIGFSRVYVGGHYVTDVVGGWALGGVFGTAVAFALLRWSKFQNRRVEQVERENADEQGC